MLPLSRQSYKAASPAILAERLVNLYAEMTPPNAQGARTMLALYGTPGMKAFADTGDTTIRAVEYMEPYLYVVGAQNVYRIDSTGAVTTCTGAIIADGDVVTANNGSQVAIVAGGNGYIAFGTNVGQIADPAFLPASSVAFIDGYFVFTHDGTGQFFISAINDGTVYDALDIATAEASPDVLVRVFVDHREVWLFGTETTEVWSDVGSADFPLQRVDGAFLERGLAAKNSVAKMDNSIFWLGDDKIVYRAAAYTPQRISNFGVESEIREMATISDARAWTYAQAGHTFYVLTFPTEQRTFVFDVATGLWHERQSGTLPNDRWRANCGLYAFGKVLAGDFMSGNVYELDLDTYTDGGNAVRRVARTPLIFDPDNQRIVNSGFQLIMETGVGLASGQGSDPQVSLRWSDDNGATWSAEKWRSAGAQGLRRTRLDWHRLGSFRNRMYEVAISDPVKVAIVGMVPEVRAARAA